MAVQDQPATGPALDEAKVGAFMEKAIGDFSGALVIGLVALGDRLGLFKTLAEQGPATSEELAKRAGVNERYAREWLYGLSSAGYLEHDRSSGRFELPPEHVPALAQEAGPMFLCGGIQMIPAMLGVSDQLADRFRGGGGVTQAEYDAGLWDGMQRFTNSWFENSLFGEWMPRMPDVVSKLEQGCDAADVGCGSGRAVIKLAQQYPRSNFVGLDISDAQIERARRNVEEAGLSDRVRIEKMDAAGGLPGKYDVITTFDVIHDTVDPLGTLKAIREALNEDGRYVCLDINCADDHADNQGPLAAMFYGFSVFYCMTTSLAHDGEGLGTCGLPEAKLRELAEQAGFGEVRRVEMDDPFNNLYELTA